MTSKIIRGSLLFFIVMASLSLGYGHASAISANFQIIPLYEQPVDPNGKLFLSSRLEPDGSDYDQYVWEDFTLASNGTLNAITWYGAYDPLLFGKGGLVVDFTVSIYPSIAAGTEPAVANPPLVKYQVGGNAGETVFSTINGTQINVYSFTLPAPLDVTAGVKYWVQIEASQQGSAPDWGFVSGSGGSGHHYIRTSGAGGDLLYRFMPGDVAMTLSGVMSGTPTSIPATSTPVSEPTTAPTDVPAPTQTPSPQTPTCLGSLIVFMMLFLFVKSASVK